MVGQQKILESMRKYHNYIKNAYLQKYVTKPSVLLDLASGKGGDLHKWMRNRNVIAVDGYDIDKISVQEAKNRYSKIKTSKPVTFSVLDLSKNILQCGGRYDVITSHFAFHYFLKSAQTLNTILSTIDNCSRPGTVLMLTILDGNLLKNIDTRNYRIKIIKAGNSRQYGRKVEIFIKDSVLNEPTIEYIVSPAFIVQKFAEIDFHLVESKLFSELPYTRFGLSKEERDYSFLNRIYVFKKGSARRLKM